MLNLIVVINFQFEIDEQVSQLSIILICILCLRGTPLSIMFIFPMFYVWIFFVLIQNF